MIMLYYALMYACPQDTTCGLIEKILILNPYLHTTDKQSIF